MKLLVVLLLVGFAASDPETSFRTPLIVCIGPICGEFKTMSRGLWDDAVNDANQANDYIHNEICKRSFEELPSLRIPISLQGGTLGQLGKLAWDGASTLYHGGEAISEIPDDPFGAAEAGVDAVQDGMDTYDDYKQYCSPLKRLLCSMSSSASRIVSGWIVRFLADQIERRLGDQRHCF